VPVDLDSEQELDSDIKSWLSFAVQKLQELKLLAQALKLRPFTTPKDRTLLSGRLLMTN
jgi:hypothetical protein